VILSDIDLREERWLHAIDACAGAPARNCFCISRFGTRPLLTVERSEEC
jgi:hypothetical protein